MDDGGCWRGASRGVPLLVPPVPRRRTGEPRGARRGSRRAGREDRVVLDAVGREPCERERKAARRARRVHAAFLCHPGTWILSVGPSSSHGRLLGADVANARLDAARRRRGDRAGVGSNLRRHSAARERLALGCPEAEWDHCRLPDPFGRGSAPLRGRSCTGRPEHKVLWRAEHSGGLLVLRGIQLGGHLTFRQTFTQAVSPTGYWPSTVVVPAPGCWLLVVRGIGRAAGIVVVRVVSP